MVKTKYTHETIRISPINHSDIIDASKVLGRGMRDNPLHLKAFGTDLDFREKALSKVFFAFLQSALTKGRILGAYSNDKVVGVCGMLQPGRCQLAPLEKIKLLPTLIQSLGFSKTFKMLEWFGEWTKHDPKTPHWHLGPVGVDRNLQGQGIGSLLLRSFCEYMDKEKSEAYLETDKAQNVEFYKKFGFETIAEADVIGVRNWFMIRKPQTPKNKD